MFTLQKAASVSFVLVFLFFVSVSVRADTFFGPTAYTSSANSPFNGVSFTYFFLENFEDGLLNTPGVIASNGFVIDKNSGAGPVDSVDADDGVIDGSGLNGRTYFNNNGSQGVTFTFNALTLGSLPTHAGVVWTDGLNPITFQAFGPGNVLLGSVTGNHADNNFNGGTGEDRFYGVFSSVGSASIRIMSSGNSGIEVDHVQYGSSIPSQVVPEPTTMFLLGTGLAGIGVSISKRRQKALNND